MAWDIETWLKVASFIISIGAMVYAWFSSRRNNVDKHMADTDEKVRTLQGQVRELKSTVAGLPAKEDLHGIQLQLAHQSGAMNEIKAILDGNAKIMGRLEDIVRRHEDHLLNGGR